MQASDAWKVRLPGDAQGRTIAFDRLSEAIELGEIDDAALVCGPGEDRFVPVGSHPRTADLVPRRPRRRRSRGEAETDMTPMIDVVFQLLIFFMIAATYTVQKTLPLPSEGPPPEETAVRLSELEKTNVMVQIGRDGAITVQGEPVAADALEDALRDAVRAADNAELVLDAHDEAAHELVVHVLDAAGAAEIAKVMFVSRVNE